MASTTKTTGAVSHMDVFEIVAGAVAQTNLVVSLTLQDSITLNNEGSFQDGTSGGEINPSTLQNNEDVKTPLRVFFVNRAAPGEDTLLNGVIEKAGASELAKLFVVYYTAVGANKMSVLYGTCDLTAWVTSYAANTTNKFIPLFTSVEWNATDLTIAADVWESQFVQTTAPTPSLPTVVPTGQAILETAFESA